MKKGKLENLLKRLNEINNLIDNATDDKFLNFNYHYELNTKLNNIIRDSNNIINPNPTSMEILLKAIEETKKKLNLLFEKTKQHSPIKIITIGQ